MMTKRFVLFVGVAVMFAGRVFAQETNAVLPVPPASKPKGGEFRSLGDPAPPITVQEWIKGRPLKIQPGTNIYVLVFCTLSRANDYALTNLSRLQQSYGDKGVTVVAISDEAPDQLRAFVQRRGAQIDFSVADDDLGRKTTSDYQRMFRQMMLPRAYVVGTNGTVLWHGHPLRDDLGLAVDAIAAGKYDVVAAQKRIVGREQMEQYLAFARQDDPRSLPAGQLMLTLRTNDAPALCELAFQIATDPYIAKRDVMLAAAALDRAEQISSTNATDIAVDRAILLFQSGKQDEGLAKARQTLKLAQSEEDQREVTACIKAMEARIAMAKTNQLSVAEDSGSGTNQPSPKP